MWKYIEYVFECIWNLLPNNDQNGEDEADEWMWMCECADQFWGAEIYDLDMRDMSACTWKGCENEKKWWSMQLMKCAAGCSKLRQAAATCSNLSQAAASCNKLQQAAANCGKLQDIHRLHSLGFDWIASIWNGSLDNSLKHILRAPALEPSREPVGGFGNLQAHASAADPHAGVGDGFRIVWNYLQ